MSARPQTWVFFHVHDDDGGICSFRARTVPRASAIAFPPHVTIVHPRTSRLGQRAWQALSEVRLDAQFVVTEVAITASDGTRWRTVRRVRLTGAACGPEKPALFPILAAAALSVMWDICGI
jgi:hypothetical protein